MHTPLPPRSGDSRPLAPPPRSGDSRPLAPLPFVEARARRRAFTLIEMMVVIGIVSILLAIAIPNLMGGGNTKVQSAAEQLGAYITRMSTEALENGADSLTSIGGGGATTLSQGFSYAANNTPTAKIVFDNMDIVLGPSISGTTTIPPNGRAIVFYDKGGAIKGVLAFRANGRVLMAGSNNRTEIIVKNTKVAYKIKIPSGGKPTVLLDTTPNDTPIDALQTN